VQYFAFGSTKSQREEELKLLEEETARRIEEAIRKNVEEKLNSEEAKLEIERRVAEGVKKLFDDVEVQLEKEKQDALTDARRKEVSILWFFSPPFCPKRIIMHKLLIILK
jgi:DNA primase large subunit